MNKQIFLLFFLCCNFIFSQYQINIEATVLDQKTSKPISLANVNFKYTKIGAFTNKIGGFNLNYDEKLINDDDVFVINAKGFKTIEIKASQLYKFLRNTNKFYLQRDEQTNSWVNDLSLSTIEESGPNLFGKVFSVSGPIQGATIMIKNSLVEAQSDFDGYFNIDAQVGDILIVNFLGMTEKQTVVEDLDDLYVLLKTEAQVLDEVVLSSSNKNEDNLVDTGYGRKNKDAVGFSNSTITKKDFSPGAINLVDVIRGQFAGVQIEGFGTPRITIRGGTGSMNTPAYAIYDVDGLIFEDFPNFINVQQIESITILKSYGATNRYGSVGRGGVFVIRMNNLYKGSSQSLDSALIKGNDYEEELSMISLENNSNYIKELEEAFSFENAKEIYLRQTSNLEFKSLPYYFDSYDYFKRWDNDYAFSILTDAVISAKSNPKALKALAYKMESVDRNFEAELVFEHLLKIRPSHEQSYRDLALIYSKNKKYVLAADIYKKILLNSIDEVEVLGLQKTIANEAYHLYTTNRDAFDFKNFPVDVLKRLLPNIDLNKKIKQNDFIKPKEFGYDYRVVFDWSDSNIEFNIQFVSPSKKFFNWSHTKFENKEQLMDEIKFGYNTEEFIIDDSQKGEWLINIDNFSIESDINPTFLKYTVYKNYGRDNEIRKTSVINLNRLTQKLTLDKLFYN
ncbi:carboxypeptidase-like regulatory domain-containing protein [Flavobacteriaceae bacterium]|nr:carboxypeptidase-like regulatory domain-containing protein [Bacteroidota bacterium]MDB4133569.1 carboxypeptidase-like regulatory domain-containing protein [Flavobacteriaceae bacterium]MDB4212616.1 carboxypeptidase-like regulatory domain-containing protein [Flavobacteriaceae bacterium]MDC1310328.1 carboxypeptidase-like regulatory domain-containing protein [Flavobacteriaceae bacterium]